MESWLENATATISTYADDTFLTVEGQNENEVRSRLEACGEGILFFFASNRMVFNVSKCSILVFRPKRRENKEKIVITLGEDRIEENSESKILGIKVQNDLRWTSHTSALCNGLKYRNCVLNRAAKQLPKGTLKGLGEGLVGSRYRYCLAVFGGAKNTPSQQ